LLITFWWLAVVAVAMAAGALVVTQLDRYCLSQLLHIL
jgi:hypothetical protein